jgi:hypothetical protein
VYKFDLTTTLQILSRLRQNAILRTELQDTRNLTEKFVAQLDIIEGKAVSCYIKNRHGQIIFSDLEALRILYGLGPLEWSLAPRQDVTIAIPKPLLLPKPALLALPPPASTRSPVPRRIVLVDQEQMISWPRRHRMVYVLIDGQKSIDRIAAMLSLPVNVVEDIIRDLQSIDVATWQ